MAFEKLVARLLTEALSSIVNAARLTSRRRRAAVSISKAIREMLAQSPDLLAAESLVVEARELLTNPTPDLLKAEKMLQDVRAAEEKRQARKTADKRNARKRTRSKARQSGGAGSRTKAKKQYRRKRKKRGTKRSKAGKDKSGGTRASS